jgi:hypothetical protein
MVRSWLTERYGVVYQTLAQSPTVDTAWTVV